MAFDFSKYATQPPTAAAPAPVTPAAPQAPPAAADTPQYDPAMTSQIWKVMDAGPSGVADDPGLTKARDYLMQNGLLDDVAANTGDSNTAERYELGLNAPHDFSLYSKTGDTPANENARLSSVEQVKGNGQKLIDPTAVKHDPLYGDMTARGNVNPNESAAMKLFWQAAPMAPALLAGGVGLGLFGGLDAAGGATAGSLVGDQTASAIGGGALNGSTATASPLLSNAPSWLTKTLPNAVKTGISGLASGNGKFDFSKYLPMALSAAASGAGLPSYALPLASTAFNLAKGGGFDFTNYLGNMAANTGINMIRQGLK